MNLVGIDIGGTKICVCLGNIKGEIFVSKRIETQPLKGSKNAIAAIQKLIQELLDSQDLSIRDIEAIGISCPGPISRRQGKILNPPNLPGWENTLLVKEFIEKLHTPTFMNNDANAGALAEWIFGSSKRVDNLVYMTLSTGLGGGIIANGQLLQGASDTAGEIGHYILQIDSPLMTGGLHGTFEAYCGGLSIALQVQKEIREKNVKTVILELADGKVETIQMTHIIEAVKKNDEYALSIWNAFLERLAQGVGILLMVLNPDAIILGTIAVHAGDLLLKPLKQLLPKYAWPEPISVCSIEPTILGPKISELSGLAVAIDGLGLCRSKVKG